MDDLRNERAHKFLRGLNENEFVEKRFTGTMLSNAFAKITAGKASGGDNVQGEFLQRLGDREREALLEIFNDRLSGGPKPAAWESPTAILLQKQSGASWVKDFRPITISSVVARVYDRMLLEFLEPFCQSWTTNQFGNRKTYQCSEAVHSLRRVFEKQWLFRRHCSCAKFDVEKAFDSTSHECIVDCLKSLGVPEWLIVAVMAEYEDTKMKVVVDEREMGVVPLRRGVRQGSPLSAMLFQLTLDYTMLEVIKKWEVAGFGVKIHWGDAECDSLNFEHFSQLLNNLCFADDQTLIAENPEDLKVMIDDVCSAISKAGLKLSLKKCTWMSSKETLEDFKITVRYVEIERVNEIVLLGNVVSTNCSADSELDHRIERAWKYFRAKSSLFMNREAKISKRLQLWNRTVARSLLWGMETLTLHESQLQRLNREQNLMVCKMMGLRRFVEDGESWVEWMIRKTRMARTTIDYHSEGPIASMYLSKHFQWAGHVARMDSQRWAFRTSSWYSLRWENSGSSEHWNAYKADFQWKRRGVGKTNKWTWDKLLQDWSAKKNLNWWSVAWDRLQWNSLEWDFVTMFQARANTPTPTIVDFEVIDNCHHEDEKGNAFHRFVHG